MIGGRITVSAAAVLHAPWSEEWTSAWLEVDVLLPAAPAVVVPTVGPATVTVEGPHDA